MVGSLNPGSSWIEAINSIGEETAKHNPETPRMDYITESTWNLIKEKKKAHSEGLEDRYKELKNQVRKQARKDRNQHNEDLVNEEMDSKTLWQGIKRLKADYTPSMYARRDMHGSRIGLEERAEATAEYLANKQWGKVELDEQERTRQTNIIKHLTANNAPEKQKEEDIDDFTLEGLVQTIKKFKLNKAPGPDKITTKILKHLTTQT